MSKSASDVEKIRCDACPVMCYIADGRAGACDRYANEGGQLVRVDLLTILERRSRLDSDKSDAGESDAADRATGMVVPLASDDEPWDGNALASPDKFVTAVGAGTTYPDYKPAPFIVSSSVVSGGNGGIDMVTVVTEGIFSYCGAKVKIDTDRHLGAECSIVRSSGEPIGHVTTGEYGSQMLSIGGVHHLTGGGKKEGRVTCSSLMALCNGEAVELTIDGGSEIVVQANKPPIIEGVVEDRMRVGCGSATVGMFASQWKGLVDEVVVVDDHITGVMSEHQAGKVIGWARTGIKVKGRRSTPGRYFQVAEPGTGWGGTNLNDPLSILGDFDKKIAKPGQSMLMVSTTGEHFTYYELDDSLTPVLLDMPQRLQQSIKRIDENCEPALCSVLFMGGAGGSLRAGVTENPVKLTRSVQQVLTSVTCGGAPTFRWPGGGITVMADVSRMPDNSFGYVPTPALVAPIEFTLSMADYEALGGHMDHVVPIEEALKGVMGPQNDHTLKGQTGVSSHADNPWPLARG